MTGVSAGRSFTQLDSTRKMSPERGPQFPEFLGAYGRRGMCKVCFRAAERASWGMIRGFRHADGKSSSGGAMRGWASDLSGLCGFRNVVEATTSGTADDNVPDFALSHSFD
jgi:hypothetical protein